MPNPDWYKKKLSELDSWHAAFSAQCAASGTTHGLSAGNVTQAATDATFVSALLNFDQQIRGFVQAWTEYRDAILRGDPAAALPGLPARPRARARRRPGWWRPPCRGLRKSRWRSPRAATAWSRSTCGGAAAAGCRSASRRRPRSWTRRRRSWPGSREGADTGGRAG